MISTPSIDRPRISHSAEVALFDNILSYESSIPAVFMPGAGEGRPDHAQTLLHSLALIEERGFEESQNERDEPPAFRQRVEAKLDINLLLLGRLLEQTLTPPRARVVRWSIRGARIEDTEAANALIGSAGILQIQPCDWLPESLELPASVFAVEPGHWTWMRFPAFAPSLHDALEQHLFRLHRRQIALSRKAEDKS